MPTVIRTFGLDKKAWFVPADDTHIHRTWLDLQISAAMFFARLPKQRRTVVQAGGHIGIFPCVFARYFDQVLTFEPNPVSFAFMEENVGDAANIRMLKAALVNATVHHVKLAHVPENTGSSYIEPHSNGGDVFCLRIDELALTDVDLLQLDIEGFEYFALEGAVEMIRRCRPVIVLEFNKCADRYGAGASHYDTERLLRKLGYLRSGKYERDVIFTWRAEQ